MGSSPSRLLAEYTQRTPIWSPSDQPSLSAFGLSRAVQKSSGNEVCIWEYHKPKDSQADGTELEVLAAGIKRLRTIRHPGIIKVLDADISEHGIYFATEAVRPLKSCISEFGIDLEEVVLGIFTVVTTVAFLHEKDLSHNNLRPESLFITDDGRWVIGGMEYTAPLGQINQKTLEIAGSHIGYSMEETEGDEKHKARETTPPPHARDSYCLGRLILAIIEPYASSLDSPFRWDLLRDAAERLSSPDPFSRPTPAEILKEPFFRDNVLISVYDFLQNIQATPQSEKVEVFNRLAANVRSLPVSTIEQYVLPDVLTLGFISEPGVEEFLGHLFVPLRKNDAFGIVPSEVYVKTICPFLEEMWRGRSLEGRVVLLKLFQNYVHELVEWDESLLTSLIIPELIRGLADSSNDIYILSLTSLISIIPRLCLMQSSGVVASGSSPTEDAPATASGDDVRRVLRKVTGEKTDKPPVLRHKTTTTLLPESAPAAPRLTKRHSIAIMSPAHAMKSPSQGSSTVTRPEDSIHRYTPQLVVENVVIPHCLGTCVSEDFEETEVWKVLDVIVVIWKRLCVLEGTGKCAPSIRHLTVSLHKMFHLILKILPPNQKVRLFCDRLSSSSLQETEVSSIHYLPRLPDLGTPFLKDGDKTVRQKFGQTLVQLIEHTTLMMDKAPTIVRRRDEGGVKARVRSAYGRFVRREGAIFESRGPRRGSVSESSAAMSASDAALTPAAEGSNASSKDGAEPVNENKAWALPPVVARDEWKQWNEETWDIDGNFDTNDAEVQDVEHTNQEVADNTSVQNEKALRREELRQKRALRQQEYRNSRKARDSLKEDSIQNDANPSS
ncbi:hypothetical protein BC832DRAFT_267835 [Gaertneriomyces semiglobifer]|nr:hypothetical protein BC832DRAFT_267835 [Gaertneriomyces semiglobifer]